MKKIGVLLVSIFIISIGVSQQAIGTNSPDASAALDVTSTNKGVLIPRIALTGNNDIATVATPQTSLMVYNTATVGGVNGVVPGFYYYNGTIWSPLVNVAQGVQGVDTTDDFWLDSLYIRGTDTLMLIKNNGNVGVGTTKPSSKLDIKGVHNNHLVIGSMGQAGGLNLRREIDGASATYIGYPAGGRNNLIIQERSGSGDISFVQNVSGFSMDTTVFMEGRNGNVGIGTTTPTSKLQVVDYYDTTQILRPFLTLADRLPGVSSHRVTDFVGITTVDKDNNSATTQDNDGMIYWGDDANEHLRFVNMKWNGTRLMPVDRMIIQENGNVGIGTTTPSGRLTVSETDQAIHLAQTIYNYNGTTPIGMQLGAWGAGYTNSAGIKFNRWSGGTPHYSAYVGQALDPLSSKYGLDFKVDELGAQGDATSSRMFIKPDGNVGIGTTNPQKKLQIEGIDGSTVNGFGITLANVSSLGRTYKIISSGNGYTHGSGKLFVSGGVTGGPKLILDSAGNFGVGVIYPTKKLDVLGETKIRTITDTTAAIHVLTSNANGVIKKIRVDSIVKASGGGADSDWNINANGTGLEGNPGTNVASGVNSIAAGGTNTASGATSVSFGTLNIASGSRATVSGGLSNTASGSHSVVSGGEDNAASGSRSIISGGGFNIASGPTSIVSGGFGNWAFGNQAMVAGGQRNIARGDRSYAWGIYAKANHLGSMVLKGDDNAGPQDSLASTAAKQYSSQFSGGYRLFSDELRTIGVELLPGAGSWTILSDSNKKENFENLSYNEILSKIKSFEITKWNYKTQEKTIKHIGPMAQDFYNAFKLGSNKTSIVTGDISGVNMAAIKGLIIELDNQKSKNKSQSINITKLEQENAQIKKELAEIKELLLKNK